MAAFAGPLQLERDPTLAAVLRMRGGEQSTRSRSRERPIEGRIREWQATAGNAAVARMLQREASPDDSGTEAGGGGGQAAPAATHEKLTYGSTGDEVRELQQRLNELKAVRIPLAVDGIYGRKTQAAVRRYQEAHPPLSVDGDAGPETWSALHRAEQGKTATQDGGAALDPWEVGKKEYEAGNYGQAYDEFTKAYEETGDVAFLWNRAQALRLLGGRRDEAIGLLELFIRSDITEEARKSAREKIAELRGPGRSDDEKKNSGAAWDLFEKGRKLYEAEEYARAYDEFTKAWEVSQDVAFLWNRAQALRLLGGRRAETIALYEQFITKDVKEEQKQAAIREIAELRTPPRSSDETKNLSVAEQLFAKGKEAYVDGHYAQAYDDFSKAHELTGDPAYLYNRAQAVRLLGGRRDQAIALFEQFIASNVSEDARKAARALLEELKGKGRKDVRAAELPF